jgi:hypothetical protein
MHKNSLEDLSELHGLYNDPIRITTFSIFSLLSSILL